MTVKQRQCLLTFLGYDTGGVDGVWGDKSRHALECCQEDLGIHADGVWGQETETAVLEAVYTYDDAPTEKTGTFWAECPNFDPTEFQCTCGGRGCNGFPADPRERLVRNAQQARDNFGKPAIVSSGVRCALRNSELPGSAANSLHLTGRAMDFAIPGVSSATLEAYVRTLPEVHECYRIDESYVHMGVQKY